MLQLLFRTGSLFSCTSVSPLKKKNHLSVVSIRIVSSSLHASCSSNVLLLHTPLLSRHLFSPFLRSCLPRFHSHQLSTPPSSFSLSFALSLSPPPLLTDTLFLTSLPLFPSHRRLHLLSSSASLFHAHTHAVVLWLSHVPAGSPSACPAVRLWFGCGSSPLWSLKKEGREAMEHSHIFTVLSTNSSSWSPRGCPLGQFPVIYYSSLLCLGLPGKKDTRKITSAHCMFSRMYLWNAWCERSASSPIFTFVGDQSFIKFILFNAWLYAWLCVIVNCIGVREMLCLRYSHL